MSKATNPQIDFGYFAAIPRSIRTEYKTLTPTQKWLYVCLKDLCGDHGTCYRALRTLSDETDISTGMLSESIQVLHANGLIHAEKKKRHEGGKEVWHITIVDIWQANGKVHPSKRSQNEQTAANVQYVNENVHCVNDKAKVCSHTERECSLCETEGRTLKQEQYIEARTVKKERSDTNASPPARLAQEVEAFFLENVAEPAPLLQVSPLVAPKTRIKPARARVVKEVKPKPDIFADAPAEVQAIATEWRTIFKTPVPVTAKLIEHATTLSAFQPEPGEVVRCRLWMYQTDTKKWYSTHGMQLGDVAREFEKFRSLASVPEVAPPKGRQISSFDDPNYDMSSEFYPSPAEKASRSYATC